MYIGSPHTLIYTYTIDQTVILELRVELSGVERPGLIEYVMINEKYRIETYKLQDVFQSIGYPSHKIQSLLKTHNSIQRNQPEEVENMKPLVLPYVSGISENIATCTSVRKLPVKVAFTSKQTLKTSLSKLTLPTPRMEKTGVVYAIHCECGGTYIGETG